MKYYCSVIAAILTAMAIPAAVWADGGDCCGWIAVESEPVDGVRVILDGKDTGQVTPTTLKNVACGAHTIEGSKRHYKFLSWSAVDAEAPPEAAAPFGKRARAYVRNAGVARIKLRFKKNFGRVVVSSVPSGAGVELDGKSMGNTPLTIEPAAPGDHTIRLTLPDYREAKKKISVRNGRTLTLDLTLPPAFGQIQVKDVKPSGAMVYLNDDAVGKAPITLKRIWSGNHTVRVEREGYHPFEKHLKLSDGQMVSVKAELLPRCGRLMVDSQPPGAKVELDGKPVGTAPLSLKCVPAGRHLLSVRINPDGRMLRKEVIVQEGKTSEAELKLKEPAPTVSISRSPTRIRHIEEPGGSDPVMTLSARPATPLRERLAWVSAGIGAASAVAATTLFALGYQTGNEADKVVTRFHLETDSSRRQALQTQIRELDREASYQKTVAWICTGASLAATGLSLYLFLTSEPDQQEQESHIGLQAGPTPSGAWVGLAGRF